MTRNATMEMTKPDLLTPTQAAAAIGCSVEAVKVRCRRHGLWRVLGPRTRLIDRRQLQELKRLIIPRERK